MKGLSGLLLPWAHPPRLRGRNCTPHASGTFIDPAVTRRRLTVVPTVIGRNGYFSVILPAFALGSALNTRAAPHGRALLCCCGYQWGRWLPAFGSNTLQEKSFTFLKMPFSRQYACSPVAVRSAFLHFLQFAGYLNRLRFIKASPPFRHTKKAPSKCRALLEALIFLL